MTVRSSLGSTMSVGAMRRSVEFDASPDAQMVEWEGAEGDAAIRPAKHRGEFRRIEAGVEQFLEQGRGLRRQLGGLEHRPVAGCEHAGQRAQRQSVGHVPG